jgi:hypothetical protein
MTGGHIENNISIILLVLCIFIAVGKCLPNAKPRKDRGVTTYIQTSTQTYGRDLSTHTEIGIGAMIHYRVS